MRVTITLTRLDATSYQVARIGWKDATFFFPSSPSDLTAKQYEIGSEGAVDLLALYWEREAKTAGHENVKLVIDKTLG
jgi:hypothetical protein